MNNIPFYKYASNGNNFVMIDEINREIIPESEKALLAKCIGHITTGIGCDTVIYIQNFNFNVLRNSHPNIPSFIMRIYENGIESNMCGNALICLAQHLQRQHQLNEAMILTEIPTYHPVFRKIQSINSTLFQVMMGTPTLPSDYFYIPPSTRIISKSKNYLVLNNIFIDIHIDDATNNVQLEHCYLTFTGEPHIVIFRPRAVGDNNDIVNRIFDCLFSEKYAGTQHLTHIGQQLNSLIENFPHGININFVELLPNNAATYRCYERGINAETFACGTGAAAVAVLIHELMLANSKTVTIYPWRAKQEPMYNEAAMLLANEFNQYTLTTTSLFLASGEYYYPNLTPSALMAA